MTASLSLVQVLSSDHYHTGSVSRQRHVELCPVHTARRDATVLSSCRVGSTVRYVLLHVCPRGRGALSNTVDPPRFLPPSNCHRLGHIVSPPPGRYLLCRRVTILLKRKRRTLSLEIFELMTFVSRPKTTGKRLNSRIVESRGLVHDNTASGV